MIALTGALEHVWPNCSEKWRRILAAMFSIRQARIPARVASNTKECPLHVQNPNRITFLLPWSWMRFLVERTIWSLPGGIFAGQERGAVLLFQLLGSTLTGWNRSPVLSK